jgi:hypothetical protein
MTICDMPSSRVSIVRILCSNLLALCNDPNVAWPYHPRSGKIGALLVDCLLHSLYESSRSFAAATDSGKLVARRNITTGGIRRKKRLDLVFFRSGCNVPLAAVEAKACMTAHAKAHTRLVAELTSSLDAVLDANSDAKFFSIVAINFGDRFTSPLNLPGPNLHGANDAPDLAKSLIRSLSNNLEIAGTLILPIRFDNERICEPYSGAAGSEQQAQDRFEQELLRSLELEK